MGKSQRDKGHNFERAVAARLRPWYPDAKRGFQTRGGTGEEPDVEGTPFYIECKAHKKPNIHKAWEQARDGSDGRAPVAVTKRDRGPWLVTMDIETFIALIDGAYRRSSE